MVSAQLKGVLNFYRKTPTNSLKFLFGANLAALGPSGSSEGVIASTPEKWSYIPLQAANDKILRVNDQLVVAIKLDTAGTSDASDGKAAIPITYLDGSTSMLNGFDSTSDWDAQVFGDVALLANQEIVIAAKTVRQPFMLGSNTQKAFISVENNA
jgi:hypothetical protein